jgi:hypothetical protein
MGVYKSAKNGGIQMLARSEIRTIFSAESDDPNTYSPPPPSWHVIAYYILRLSIYVFHTNKDQGFSCRMLPFLYHCDKKIAKYERELICGKTTGRIFLLTIRINQIHLTAHNSKAKFFLQAKIQFKTV